MHKSLVDQSVEAAKHRGMEYAVHYKHETQDDLQFVVGFTDYDDLKAGNRKFHRLKYRSQRTYLLIPPIIP